MDILISLSCNDADNRDIYILVYQIKNANNISEKVELFSTIEQTNNAMQHNSVVCFQHSQS